MKKAQYEIVQVVCCPPSSHHPRWRSKLPTIFYAPNIKCTIRYFWYFRPWNGQLQQKATINNFTRNLHYQSEILRYWTVLKILINYCIKTCVYLLYLFDLRRKYWNMGWKTTTEFVFCINKKMNELSKKCTIVFGSTLTCVNISFLSSLRVYSMSIRKSVTIFRYTLKYRNITTFRFTGTYFD